MQSKTTRAFRTISEAGEELDLQPHVLRFWESKFPQIKPIKRGGGRRFYRPEDIEFLRGIKILLHDEGHPIKDVQKLIRLKGSTRVMELGQSVEKAARDKKVEETVLVPSRIQKSSPHKVQENITQEAPEASEPKTVVESVADLKPFETAPVEDVVSLPEDVVPALPVTVDTVEAIVTGPSPEDLQHRQDLEEALERLHALKSRWSSFKAQSS